MTRVRSPRPAARAGLTPGLLLAALSLAAAPAARAEPATYEIDPEHLSIGFLVEHVGYASVLGMFRAASGSYVFDEATGELRDVQVVVETASVFTGHDKRDGHLRSADFLDCAEFPRMTFTAAKARRDGERKFVIEGQLELLGRSRPMVLEATWNKSADSPIGGSLFGGKPYVMGVSARGSFRRSSYGMTYGVDNGWVGDEVRLIVEFEAKRR